MVNLLNFHLAFFLRTLFCLFVKEKREFAGRRLEFVWSWTLTSQILRPIAVFAMESTKWCVPVRETHKIPEKRSLCKEKLLPINLTLDASRGRSLPIIQDSIAFISILDRATWNLLDADCLRIDPWRRRQHLKIFAKPNRSVMIAVMTNGIYGGAFASQLFSSLRPSPNANRDKHLASRRPRKEVWRRKTWNFTISHKIFYGDTFYVLGPDVAHNKVSW